MFANKRIERDNVLKRYETTSIVTTRGKRKREIPEGTKIFKKRVGERKNPKKKKERLKEKAKKKVKIK